MEGSQGASNENEVDQINIPIIDERGMEFMTYKALDDFLERYSKYNNFYLTRNTSAFSKEKSLENFGKIGVIQRGRYHCNFKNKRDKSNKSIKTSCCFLVAFTYDYKIQRYVIKPSPMNLKHNHPMVSRADHVDRVVTLERDLSKEEYQVIWKNAPYFNVPKIREILKEKFPIGRDYGPGLLSRILKKGKEQHYRQDMEDHPLYELTNSSLSNINEKMKAVAASEIARKTGSGGNTGAASNTGNTSTSTSSAFLASLSTDAAYHQVSYPPTELPRYTRLREKSDRLIMLAMNDEHLFRMLMVNFKELEDHVSEHKGLSAFPVHVGYQMIDTGGSSSGATPGPSSAKRARRSNEDVVDAECSYEEVALL